MEICAVTGTIVFTDAGFNSAYGRAVIRRRTNGATNVVNYTHGPTTFGRGSLKLEIV